MSEPHKVSEPDGEEWCRGCNRPLSRCLCDSLETVWDPTTKTWYKRRREPAKTDDAPASSSN